MPSTTIHISKDLLSKLDQVVQEEGISRNRFIIEACKRFLQDRQGEWPSDFFDADMDDTDLRLLREGGKQMETDIFGMRKNRRQIEL